MNYPIDAITSTARRREDNGDLAGLAESIARYGLLHPVVIDDEGTLVAGGRRLEAAKLLGWTSIAVTRLGELSENERRAIELEENLRRKDLTDWERSRDLATLVHVAKQVEPEISQFRSESERNLDNWSSGKISTGGRPKDQHSLRAISERINVPAPTIIAAQHHVETANTFPVMQSWPQYRVLEARQHINELPEDERGQAVAIVSEPGIPTDTAVAMLGNLAKMPRSARTEIYTLYASTDDHDRNHAKTMAARLPPVPEPALIAWKAAERAITQALNASRDDQTRELGASMRATARQIISQLEEIYEEERRIFVA